jgi:hypothetical protein
VRDDLTILQISAPIAPGSSGGPIFNERGEVVGVCTALIRGGQNLNFGVPTNYVKALLRAPDPMTIDAFVAATAPPDSASPVPGIIRRVPQHAPQILDGCDAAALELLLHGISDAIDVGAPLYNNGNHAGCFHVYEGAAADLERRLPRACRGPAEALAAGRKRAASLGNATEQAWAMRDAFDGLVAVIAKKRGPK